MASRSRSPGCWVAGASPTGHSRCMAPAHSHPPLPGADTVNIVAQGKRTFTIRSGAPVQDLVLQLASFGSVFTFLPGTPVTKVSGDPTLTVTGNTASGFAAGSMDSNGTLRLYGLYT